MRLVRKNGRWSYSAVLVWAALWMLMVPLFHVHPEADHRHGESGHVHGGTVHTVWSPDLDCEFTNHENYKKTSGNSAQFSHSGDGHTEFGLSLLTDSPDRRSFKPFLIQALGFSPNMASVVEQSAWIRLNIAAVPSSLPFIHTVASRGPPDLLG